MFWFHCEIKTCLKNRFIVSELIADNFLKKHFVYTDYVRISSPTFYLYIVVFMRIY